MLQRRSSAWRKAARLARPLVITILAALAFMALLRFHHAKFEDSMVRNFQRQQFDAVHNLAGSIEERIQIARGDLVSIASRPEVSQFAPGMKEILSSHMRREDNPLDDLWVLDARGAELWRSPSVLHPQSGKRSVSAKAQPDTVNLALRIPIKQEGRQVGTLCAVLNVSRVAIGCQSKAASASKSVYWLLSDTGEVIRGSVISGTWSIANVLRNPDSPKTEVHDSQFLPYVAGRCIGAGESGLAEVVRQNDQVRELIAFAPINLEGRKFGLAIGSPKADVSVPIASHERVTYALIVALALLYFATGYTAYRSERAHAQLEEQRRMTAEQASKAKGDFLAKMSHELRTPMNGVISMTELAMGAANQAERQRCLCMVRQCANSLLTVINDVLDISKIEAGKLELCRVPLNVPECVINTLAVLASLAKDKGLSLRWGIAPDVPSVVIGDPGRLRQVLNNLIGNAIKFTSSGEVDVRVMPQAVHSDKTVLRFTVQDTGRGMSPQDQWRAFTPYYQCPDSQRYRKDSTGLGLAITKQLVELMGGRISVRSEIGKGSTFTFTIRFGPPIEEGSGLAKETLPSLTTIRALVVSAIPANLRRFRGALESWGAVPGSAEDSDAALLALKDAQGRGSPFALVLFDSSGSGMDPFDFAEELSTLEGYEGVALAVIHPAGLRGDAIRCLQTGIDVYLGIPIEDDQLHLALSMAVQHAASQKCLSLITRHTFLDARSLRILLVDDNPVNREAASMLMSQWGHKVQAACAGEEAVSISAEREFDLVLMDLEMPGISGIEATEQIRRREQGTGRRTPIVAMTAYALDSDRQRCLQAGMDEYLTKPFRPDQLRKLISAVSVGGVGRPIQPPSPANAPTPPADRAAWNPSEALRLADGNKKTVGIIVSTFLRDLRETLPAAQNAALTRDGKTLAKYAHRWKGSLGLLGAERSLSCAVKLEDACRSGEPERLLEYFQRLHEELLALEQALSSTEQDNVQCKSL